VRNSVVYSARPTANGSCLIKRSLPGGRVFFEDVCTKEKAATPPAGAQSQLQLKDR
jgi:hypothetical protein